MSDILYRAHPSVWRTHPVGTLIVWLLLLLGAVIAITGEIPYLQPYLADVQLPAAFELRYVGYGLVALMLLRLVGWWISSVSDHLEIRTNEVIWTHGLLSRTYTEIKMSSIRTVRVQQSLLQRILGAGDLVILTAGDIPEVSIRGLPRPHEIRDHVKRQTDPLPPATV